MNVNVFEEKLVPTFKETNYCNSYERVYVTKSEGGGLSLVTDFKGKAIYTK